MKRKIIIGIVAAILIGVASFAGYTAYQNNKENNVSQEQKEEPNTTSDDNSEVDEETSKDENSSGYTEESVAQMDDEEKEATAAMQTFMNAIKTTQNIKNTEDATERAKVQENIDKYLIGNAKETAEEILKNVQSSELIDLQIITERSETVTLGNGTEQNGYMIYYRAKFLDKELGKEEEREDDAKNNKDVDFSSAFVVKDNNGEYKVSHLYIPAIKELPDYCK